LKEIRVEKEKRTLFRCYRNAVEASCNKGGFQSYRNGKLKAMLLPCQLNAIAM